MHRSIATVIDVVAACLVTVAIEASPRPPPSGCKNGSYCDHPFAASVAVAAPTSYVVAAPITGCGELYDCNVGDIGRQQH